VRPRHDDPPIAYGSGLTAQAAAVAERILTKWGLATLLALGLVWWIASDVSGTMRDIRTKLDLHTNDTTFYLRQVCLNTAKDESQRAGCIPSPSMSLQPR
jgi:hypothetical protein